NGPPLSALANIDVFGYCLSVLVFIHSDQVALHSAASILQHSAELFPIIEDEKVDVQFRWSSLVVGNLSGAVRVHGRLACIDGGNHEAAKTLGALAGEKSICVTGARAQKRERRQ